MLMNWWSLVPQILILSLLNCFTFRFSESKWINAVTFPPLLLTDPNLWKICPEQPWHQTGDRASEIFSSISQMGKVSLSTVVWRHKEYSRAGLGNLGRRVPVVLIAIICLFVCYFCNLYTTPLIWNIILGGLQHNKMEWTINKKQQWNHKINQMERVNSKASS